VTCSAFRQRVMPGTLGIAIATASATGAAIQAGPSQWRWAAVAACSAALISTVIFNVRINLATGRWNRDQPPEDWKRTRNRWELFQCLRSWLLLAGFVLTCIGFAAG
jgi:anthrone oxygenase-like protein